MTIYHTVTPPRYSSRHRTLIDGQSWLSSESGVASGEADMLTVQDERWVRRDERRFLRTLIDATITDGEYQRLLLALAQLDPKAKQTCGNLVHALVCVLDGLEQETQAA